MVLLFLQFIETVQEFCKGIRDRFHAQILLVQKYDTVRIRVETEQAAGLIHSKDQELVAQFQFLLIIYVPD